MARSSTRSKTAESAVAAARARLFKLTYANPISGLTPTKLIGWLNAYRRGELRQAALAWHEMLERDDMLKPCAGKRIRAVSSLKWEVLPIEDSPEANRHKAALEHFYNNLAAYDGLNEMERGGIRQLFRQMMSAVGMRYAVHEIIWRPGTRGGLTADFKFLPLQFFESTTGRLRYLPEDYALAGTELDEVFGDGGWMCNCGEGLMFASSIAYLFKTPTGLKAWVSYMEKFAMPPLHGQTSAAKDTAEWNEVKDALTGYGEDLALLTDPNTKITPLELKNAGQAPHAPLVDRMDRALSRIWMGGDLATMSKDGGAVGSQPQGDDLAKLQEDDAAMISDSLQHYVDAEVIRQTFGEGVEPLAYFQLSPPARMDIERERATDTFLIGAGVAVGKRQLQQRYGRTEPDAKDELATAPAVAPSPFARAANEATARSAARDVAFKASATAELTAAQRTAFAPLVTRLQAILALDDAALPAALDALKADLPSLYRTILADPALAAAWEKIFGTALVSGFAEAAQQKSTP